MSKFMERAMLTAPQGNKYAAERHGSPMRKAKPSELLALQRRINKKYGHPYILPEIMRSRF